MCVCVNVCGGDDGESMRLTGGIEEGIVDGLRDLAICLLTQASCVSQETGGEFMRHSSHAAPPRLGDNSSPPTEQVPIPRHLNMPPPP